MEMKIVMEDANNNRHPGRHATRKEDDAKAPGRYSEEGCQNPKESRPYYGYQEPEFGEGGPFGRQADHPLFGPHMTQIGSPRPATGQGSDSSKDKTRKSSAKQPNES